MSKYRRLLIASMASLVIQKTIKAQSNFVVLEKNVNFRAKDLVHELSTSKDSLILKGKEKIKYIYSINKDYQREIDTYAGTNYYRLPITHLTPGKHLMVVNYKTKLIVFVLKVFRDEVDLIASNSDLERNPESH